MAGSMRRCSARGAAAFKVHWRNRSFRTRIIEAAAMALVIISGALANKPGNGGGAWERMSWPVGLRQLGCDVFFLEQIDPSACVDGAGAPARFADSVNLAWFQFVTKWFDVADRAALI